MAQRNGDDSDRSRMDQALELVAQGFTQLEIGRQLGLSQGATIRLLTKARGRMLARVAAQSQGIKCDLELRLQWIEWQCADSFLRSKTPRKRAAVRRAPGDGDEPKAETTTTEIVERDGDTSYLNTMMQAMRVRMLIWGLDVLPAENDAMTTFAAVAADMARRGELYEAERRARDAYGDSPDGDGSPS
jgi:hypothetical protein